MSYDFYIGKNESGESIFSNNVMMKSNALVIGQVGTGKSTLIDNMINGMIQQGIGLKTTDEINYVYCTSYKIKLKKYESGWISEYFIKYINSYDSFIDFLNNDLLEIERQNRQKLLNKYNCKDVNDFNSKVDSKRMWNENINIHNKKIPHIFIFIDEFFIDSGNQDIFHTYKDDNIEKKKLIIELIEKSMMFTSTLGFHFVISTNGIDSNIHTRKILKNSLLRLCTGYGIQDGYSLKDEKLFFGKNIYIPQTYQGFGIGYNDKNIFCFKLKDAEYFEQKETVKKQFNSIKLIEVIKLFGYHSYKIDFTKSNKLSIIFGTNGLGKTTIFKILEKLFISKNIVEDYYSINYLLNDAIFESFRIVFFNGSEIIITKDSKKMHINYIEIKKSMKSDLIFERDFSTNRKTQVAFHKNVIEHYKKVNCFLPINGDNKLLMIKTNRLTDGYTIALHLQEEFMLNKNQIESDLRNINILSRKIDSFSVVPFVVELRNRIISMSNDVCNFHDRLIYDEIVSPDYIEVPKEIIEWHKKICEDGFCNQQFKKMKIIEGETYYYDHQDLWNSVFDDFIYKYHEYVEFYKKYLLFKKYYESFYYDYDPSYKILSIDENCNCCVKNSNNVILKFESLSSGEINIAIVLYNFIFNVSEGVIAFIDEPEISLHIAWQEKFADIILELIGDKKNVQVIVASHSPFIASGREDLMIEPELIEMVGD